MVQNPFKMGYQGVHNVYKAMNGLTIEVDSKVFFVSRNNINNAEVKQMLSLPLSVSSRSITLS